MSSARFSALAAVVTSEVQRRSRRAFLLAVGAALLASFALGASVLPTEITANLLVSYAVFLGAFALALLALLYRQFGGEFGDALAVAGWARLEAEDRWRRLGAGRIPRTPAEATAWLQQHDDPTTLQQQRLSAQLVAGDLVTVRVGLATYPMDTPYERFDAANDRWFLDFMDGELPPLADLEAMAAALRDPAERRQAIVATATLRAHAAVADGRDWVAPVAAVRDVVGDAASGIIWARYILPAWTMLMAISALFVGGALLFGRLTGVWR